MWFWRTTQGDEVDLLVETAPERFVAVECKAAERVGAADLKGVRHLRDEYGPQSLARALIACRTGHDYPLGPEARADLSTEQLPRAVPVGGPSGLLAEIRKSLPA
jgi:hypothetical protein